VTGTLAIAPLTDFSTWLRGRGLEIVLIVLGALLLARFANWSGRRITERMDVASTDVDAVVRSEAAKHRRAVAQILTLLTIGVIWSVAGVLILDRLGVPVASLVASAAVIGAALGFGASSWCGTSWLACSSSGSASTATAILSTSLRPASRAPPARSRRSPCEPPGCAP
jgi:small conductance mechanosensitive channel